MSVSYFIFFLKFSVHCISTVVILFIYNIYIFFFNVDFIALDMGCSCHQMLYLILAVPYISRFIDPYNPTIVIVQLYYGVNLRMQSSCRSLLFRRENVLQSCNNVKFFHGLGSYDFWILQRKP